MVNPQSHVRDRSGLLPDSGAGECVERNRALVGGRRSLGLRKSKQAGEQPVHVIELSPQPISEDRGLWRRRAWLGHGDIERRPHRGKRRSQFVRGVRNEPPLRLERPFQTLEQCVEGIAELFDLVLGTVKPEARVQVGGRDFPRGGGDQAQWLKEVTCSQPTERN